MPGGRDLAGEAGVFLPLPFTKARGLGWAQRAAGMKCLAAWLLGWAPGPVNGNASAETHLPWNQAARQAGAEGWALLLVSVAGFPQERGCPQLPMPASCLPCPAPGASHGCFALVLALCASCQWAEGSPCRAAASLSICGSLSRALARAPFWAWGTTPAMFCWVWLLAGPQLSPWA